jgi:hypothetical protein
MRGYLNSSHFQIEKDERNCKKTVVTSKLCSFLRLRNGLLMELSEAMGLQGITMKMSKRAEDVEE